MSTPDDRLSGLVERLEKASEGSRELDAEIFRVALGAEVWSYNDNAHIDAQIANGNWKGRREAHPDFDASFDQAVTWRYKRDADYGEVPRLTSSIDAAMTLVPEKHGWALNYASMASVIRLGPNGAIDGEIVSSWPDDQREAELPVSPAIALCIAALKAKSRSPQP